MNTKDNIPVINLEAFGKSYLNGKSIERAPSSIYDLDQHLQISKRCKYQPHKGAHRLDFYLVFLVTGGEGIHTFGLKEYYITKNMLCFAGPDVITSWNSSAEEQLGFLCAFSHEFFTMGLEDKFFLNEMPFFHMDGHSVLQLTDEQMRYYRPVFELMYQEYQNRNAYSEHVLRSLLHSILDKAYSQYQLNQCQRKMWNHSGLRLLKSFTELYLDDFKPLKNDQEINLKKVGDYADQLGVSQNHLNDTLKAVTGKSAGQLIKDQLLKQATMYLRQSSKSVSEIAYLLGYDDPSYFTRYYKKQTGVAPSELKKNKSVL